MTPAEPDNAPFGRRNVQTGLTLNHGKGTSTTQANPNVTTRPAESPTSLPATIKARRPRRRHVFDLQQATAIIEGYDGAELLNQAKDWLAMATALDQSGEPMARKYALVAVAALRRYMLDGGTPLDRLA